MSCHVYFCVRVAFIETHGLKLMKQLGISSSKVDAHVFYQSF